MIPCRPAPAELQVSYATGPAGRLDGAGTFKSIRVDRTSTEDDMKEGEVNRPVVLTFGLLYDVIEMAWFHHAPRFGYELHIDYFPPDFSESSDCDRRRRALRAVLPQQPIGGLGRVLVHLNRPFIRCATNVLLSPRKAAQRVKPEVKIFTNEFQCVGRVMVRRFGLGCGIRISYLPLSMPGALSVSSSLCQRRSTIPGVYSWPESLRPTVLGNPGRKF